MFAITFSFARYISRRTILPALGLFVLTGCGEDNPTRDTPLPVVLPVSRVAITTAPTLVVMSGQLAATTFAANDSVLTGRTISWATSDPSLAIVSATGLVTSVGSGWVSITATSEGKSGSADVQVIYIPVVAVEVTQLAAPIIKGGTIQLTAQTLSPTGLPMFRAVTWSSSDISKARVNQSGLVTAIGEGSVTITAASEGVSGNAVITILPLLTAAR